MPQLAGFDFMSFLPIVLIFGIFYFLLIRPQQKKMREHQAMLAAIRRGDKIVTNGGIIGTVSKLTNDKELLVEIADGVRVRILRSMIAEVLVKTEAANSDIVEKKKKLHPNLMWKRNKG
ncbi:preprotein translocase subunit YajC [Candidatus Paracaedibacter symbiosus]|uniref:preprotein translocase subunit YajC n=1 Tax=Candidatus Paracaedibacter symbiosus TaxID=244582 RepID=UPI00069214F4|nr:preprotein translocase subunit YajC [Candidatus Paracaedibacter symbiosus]